MPPDPNKDPEGYLAYLKGQGSSSSSGGGSSSSSGTTSTKTTSAPFVPYQNPNNQTEQQLKDGGFIPNPARPGTYVNPETWQTYERKGVADVWSPGFVLNPGFKTDAAQIAQIKASIGGADGAPTGPKPIENPGSSSTRGAKLFNAYNTWGTGSRYGNPGTVGNAATMKASYANLPEIKYNVPSDYKPGSFGVTAGTPVEYPLGLDGMPGGPSATFKPVQIDQGTAGTPDFQSMQLSGPQSVNQRQSETNGVSTGTGFNTAQMLGQIGGKGTTTGDPVQDAVIAKAFMASRDDMIAKGIDPAEATSRAVAEITGASRQGGVYGFSTPYVPTPFPTTTTTPPPGATPPPATDPTGGMSSGGGGATTTSRPPIYSGPLNGTYSAPNGSTTYGNGGMPGPDRLMGPPSLNGGSTYGAAPGQGMGGPVNPNPTGDAILGGILDSAQPNPDKVQDYAGGGDVFSPAARPTPATVANTTGTSSAPVQTQPDNRLGSFTDPSGTGAPAATPHTAPSSTGLTDADTLRLAQESRQGPTGGYAYRWNQAQLPGASKIVSSSGTNTPGIYSISPEQQAQQAQAAQINNLQQQWAAMGNAAGLISSLAPMTAQQQAIEQLLAGQEQGSFLGMNGQAPLYSSPQEAQAALTAIKAQIEKANQALALQQQLQALGVQGYAGGGDVYTPGQQLGDVGASVSNMGNSGVSVLPADPAIRQMQLAIQAANAASVTGTNGNYAGGPNSTNLWLGNWGPSGGQAGGGFGGTTTQFGGAQHPVPSQPDYYHPTGNLAAWYNQADTMKSQANIAARRAAAAKQGRYGPRPIDYGLGPFSSWRRDNPSMPGYFGPLDYAKGGSMTTPEEIVGIGRFSGKPYFRVGEPTKPGGPPMAEKLHITPLHRPAKGASKGLPMGKHGAKRAA